MRSMILLHKQATSPSFHISRDCHSPDAAQSRLATSVSISVRQRTSAAHVGTQETFQKYEDLRNTISIITVRRENFHVFVASSLYFPEVSRPKSLSVSMSQRGGTYSSPSKSELPSSICEHTETGMRTSAPLAKQSSTFSSFTILANDKLTLLVALDAESRTWLRKSNTEKKDDPEWTIIEKPAVDKNEDEGHAAASAISSQFKLDLGWGSWRTTVFSWDINVNKH